MTPDFARGRNLGGERTEGEGHSENKLTARGLYTPENE